MPTPPFAQLLISVNGDTAVAGSRDDLDFEDTIALSSADTAHPKAFLFEIFAYPAGFTCPAGWSTAPDGTYYYSGSSSAPAFDLAASPTWGKWLYRLTINNGDPGVSNLPASQFVDESCGANIYDPNNGFEDVALFETTQFSQERPNGVRPIQDNLRRTTGSGTIGGIEGDQGPQGDRGVADLVYLFGTSTVTGSNPGSGNFRLNNVTHSLATVLAVADADANGGSAEAYLLAQDDSTSAVRGYVTIRSRTTIGTWRKYAITGASTDSSGWVQFAVTYLAGSGSIASAEPCDLVFSRTGDKGDSGDEGGGGGGGLALSNTFYVDGATTATTHDGSDDAPYLTMQAALDDHPALDSIALLVVPGTYTEDLTMDRFNGAHLAIASTAPKPPESYDAAAGVILDGTISLTGSEGACILTLQDARVLDDITTNFAAFFRSHMTDPAVVAAPDGLSLDNYSSVPNLNSSGPTKIRDLSNSETFVLADAVSLHNPFPANYRFTGLHQFSLYLQVTGTADAGGKIHVTINWTDNGGARSEQIVTDFPVDVAGYKYVGLPLRLNGSAVTYTVTKVGVTGSLTYFVDAGLHSLG